MDWYQVQVRVVLRLSVMITVVHKGSVAMMHLDDKTESETLVQLRIAEVRKVIDDACIKFICIHD